jgi:hypothetical protein
LMYSMTSSSECSEGRAERLARAAFIRARRGSATSKERNREGAKASGYTASDRQAASGGTPQISILEADESLHIGNSHAEQ